MTALLPQAQAIFDAHQDLALPAAEPVDFIFTLESPIYRAAKQACLALGFVEMDAECLARAWYADGLPMWVREYHAGREDGVHTGWWPDGTRKFRLAYVDGLLEGASHEWYIDGKPFRDSNYHRGQETGLQRMYDADGAVRASYEVRGGRRYGSIGAVGCTPKRASNG